MKKTYLLSVFLFVTSLFASDSQWYDATFTAHGDSPSEAMDYARLKLAESRSPGNIIDTRIDRNGSNSYTVTITSECKTTSWH
jgi:hypothetical protein